MRCNKDTLVNLLLLLVYRYYVLCTRITLINESQCGFRKQYSTIDHIISLQFLSHTLMSSKKKLFCAFVDFKQAFDTVWRNGLWSKLAINEINGEFQLCKKKYVYGNYIKNCHEFFSCNVGVRQGENLSPFYSLCILMTWNN